MSERWTVTGRIVVDHILPELREIRGSRSAVEGILVKVSARSRVLTAWGTWSEWDTVRAGADGGFRVSAEKNSDRRQFKVQVLFDSSALRIKEGKETKVELGGDGFPIDIDLDLTDKDWHLVHSDKDDDTDRRAGLHNLGDIVLTGIPRKHADMWILYDAAIDLMRSYGSAFAFKDKIVVKYPMSISPAASSSYWNPLNGHGYIKEDQFNAYTLLHELTHKWEYDHCTGETSMAWQLAKHGSTHQARENTTHVPFLESFADFWAVKTLQAVSGGKLTNFLQAPPYARADHPFTRDYIGGTLAEEERNVANLGYTERGWYGLFAALTFQWLDRIDPDRPFTDVNGTDTRYAFLSLFSDLSDLRTGYTFKDVLSVFLAAPTRSIDAIISTREMNYRDFLNRAGRILSDLDAEKIRKVKTLLSPSPQGVTT